MTAQPTEDPADPLAILRCLPEREHEEFLRQYHQAVDAAHDPASYQQLRRLLHVWRLTAAAAGQPGYYEVLEAARAGEATAVPVADAIGSKEALQIFDGQADVSEYVAQRAFGDVAAGMHRDGRATTVGMTHDVMTARNPSDFEARPL